MVMVMVDDVTDLTVSVDGKPFFTCIGFQIITPHTYVVSNYLLKFIVKK